MLDRPNIDPTLGRREKIKETIVLGLLNVALPSADIYSDLLLFVRFSSPRGRGQDPEMRNKRGDLGDLTFVLLFDRWSTSIQYQVLISKTSNIWRASKIHRL